MTFTEQIARLAELDKLRTQGEWTFSCSGDKRRGVIDSTAAGPLICDYEPDDGGNKLTRAKNFEFIATSANVITRLLVERTKMEKMIKTYANHDRLCDLFFYRDSHCNCGFNDAKAELERL